MQLTLNCLICKIKQNEVGKKVNRRNAKVKFGVGTQHHNQSSS